MVYGESEIQVYEGLEGVRKRPEMYIGDTEEKGFHHLLWEIIDNAIDEHLQGFGKEISITIVGNKAIVEDFGRGIPFGTIQKTGKSGIETVMTFLHAGGKFGGEGYTGGTGGLHGLGASCVNALSSHLKVIVWREMQEVTMSFSKGKKTNESRRWLTDFERKMNKTGTTIEFVPDTEIFSNQTWDKTKIVNRLKQIAYLNDIRIELTFKGKTETFYYSPNRLQRGIEELVDYKGYLTDAIFFSSTNFECAFQVVSRSNRSFFSFVNNIPTPLGGSHETGVKTGMVRFWKQVSKKDLKSDELCKYIVCLLSARVENAKFESQTKEKLSINKKLEGEISSFVSQNLMDWYESEPTQGKEFVKLIEKLSSNQEVEEKKDEKEVKIDNTHFVSGKLAQASSKNPDKNELYIVEGDSAGGSAKQGRDRTFQAILQLRGKPVNVEKKQLDVVMQNEEVKLIAYALGGIGKGFKIEKCPYKKVIMMTDADVDGRHIQMILLTLFFKYFRDIIRDGRLYLSRPPLFMVTKGNKHRFVLDQAELKKLQESLTGSYEIKRLKGLGEMNAQQLKETSLDITKRVLYQITLDDEEFVQNWVEALMGSGVKARKEFITTIFE